MLNAGRLWLGNHSFVGVVRHVELGYELDVLLALRQSEDIVGPSGKPLFLYFFFFFCCCFSLPTRGRVSVFSDGG